MNFKIVGILAASLLLVGCGPEQVPVATQTEVSVTTTQAQPSPVATREPGPLLRGMQAVFFGDSYTNTSGELTGGIDSYARLLSAENGWIETDKAFGGVGYQFFLEQLDQLRHVGPDIDIVFVLGGNNDIARAYDPAWRSLVTEFYHKLRETTPKAVIYALSPLWGGLPINKDMLAVRSVIEDAVATTEGACYVDLHDPLTGRSDLLVSDGMHPNQDGQRAILNALLENMHPWPYCTSGF